MVGADDTTELWRPPCRSFFAIMIIVVTDEFFIRFKSNHLNVKDDQAKEMCTLVRHDLASTGL